MVKVIARIWSARWVYGWRVHHTTIITSSTCWWICLHACVMRMFSSYACIVCSQPSMRIRLGCTHTHIHTHTQRDTPIDTHTHTHTQCALAKQPSTIKQTLHTAHCYMYIRGMYTKCYSRLLCYCLRRQWWMYDEWCSSRRRGYANVAQRGGPEWGFQFNVAKVHTYIYICVSIS